MEDLLKPSPLPLENLITLSIGDHPHHLLKTQTDCHFYLKPQDPATTKDVQKIAITIVGPTEFSLPLINYTTLSDVVVGTFRPLLPGLHTIEAFYGTHLLQGCPTQFLVSRNYEGPIRRIISWDMEIPDSSSEAVQIRRPWGICCNTKTEQVGIILIEKNFHHFLK